MFRLNKVQRFVPSVHPINEIKISNSNLVISDDYGFCVIVYFKESVSRIYNTKKYIAVIAHQYSIK